MGWAHHVFCHDAPPDADALVNYLLRRGHQVERLPEREAPTAALGERGWQVVLRVGPAGEDLLDLFCEGLSPPTPPATRPRLRTAEALANRVAKLAPSRGRDQVLAALRAARAIVSITMPLANTLDLAAVAAEAIAYYQSRCGALAFVEGSGFYAGERLALAFG